MMKEKTTTCLKDFTCLVIALFALLVGTSNSESIRIHNANDLINFSNNVSKGSTYSGTTVYLDSDIEFDPGLSELFTSIGITSSCYFNGIFDGQGHIISNLNITSSSQYTGLFGYSAGATIKNLVIDKSCTITSTYSSTSSGDGYVGSIISYCYSSNNPCTIANTVNIGSVSFGGSVQRDVCIGGIAGYLSVPDNGYSINIKNCANYGYVTNTGSAGTNGYIEVGGIAGYCAGTSNVNCKVQNSANHGVLTNQGSAKKIYVGGIAGAIEEYGTIENCVNTGDLNNKYKTASVGEMIGLIQSSNDVALTHCLSTGSNGYYGFLSTSSGSPKVTNSSTSVSLSLTTVNELNEYSEDSDGFNKWILNLDEKEVSFNINGEKVFSITSQLILLPDLDGDSEHTFSGWFNDSSCTNKFISESVSSDTTLYGGWGYKVSLSLDDGTIITKNVTYGQQYGMFSSITNLKEGHTLKWFTEENGEGEEITAESIVSTAGDHTLYGHYAPNNYTVAFDFGNGTTLNETVEYDKEINFPEDAEREGYTFNGWNNSSGITRMPGHDITFTANWTEITQSSSISSSSSNDRIYSSSSLTRGISHLSSPSSSPSFSPSSSSPSSKIGEKSISSSSIQIPSEYVEIVFSKKDLSEEEIKEIINKYVDNAEYEMKITKMDDGTTVVIIKFVDVETATNFVENINAGNDLDKGLIKQIDFTTERTFSFSLLIFPLVHLLILFI